MDRYRLHQLTSTRYLAMGLKDKVRQTVVKSIGLVGGVNYDYLPNAGKNTSPKKTAVPLEKGSLKTATRAPDKAPRGLNYLQGTEAEGTLVTDRSASVTLICRSYQPMQIGASARVPLQRQNNRCGKAADGFATLYFRFFWDNITREKGDPEKKRREYMGNLGGVIRGEEKCPAFNFKTDTINHYRGDFTIRTLPTEEPASDGMNVGLYEDYDSRTPLRVIQTSDNTLSVSSMVEGLPRGTAIHWVPSFSKGRSCTRNYLRLWKEDEFNALCERYLRGFASTIDTEAERHHILGFFLERDCFYADALRFYRMALEKEPDNVQYASSFEWFTKAYR